ncbi:MAG: carbonic anhydrase [Methylophilaceae bacterium]|nr:carbonic anhydrase [Methylophilaceae bacterium]
MRIWIAGVSCVVALMSELAIANEEPAGSETERLQGIVRNLLDDNAAFARTHKSDYYKPFAEKQRPRATVVTCSDSRVHTHAFDKTPDGDLFMVRNIGNQIATAEGSVEYGVLHLHTPLLIIIGHVACGAIKAAQGDYSKLEASIRRELETLKLPKRNPKNDEEEEWLRGVDANVHYQVDVALKKFANEVKEGRLTVIGAVYDFLNAKHQGQGRLVVININGNTDSSSILSGLMKLTGAGIKLDKKPAGKPADNKKAAAH